MIRRNYGGGIVFVVFILLGLGFIAAGFFADPLATTDDGFSLKNFFFVMGAWFGILPLIIFGLIGYFNRRNSQNVAFMRSNGIKGKARVMGMRQTGVRINHVPQVVLDLEITTQFGEKITTTYKKCIQPIYYNIMRPDADLIAYIHPEKKEKVFIDFEESWKQMTGQ